MGFSRTIGGGTRFAVIGTVVVVALFTASCGSSSKNAASPGGSATTTSLPATKPTTAKTSGSAPSTSSKAPNPCTLITNGDVTAIIGSTPKPVGPTSANRGSNCKWDAGGSFVLVQVFQGKEFYSPTAQANSPKNLAGVGDQAFEDVSGTTSVNVGFLKGSTAVFISGFYVKSADAVVQAAKDAASKV